MAELDTNKTYLVWQGSEFPNSENATFKAPAGATIDWGDGTEETFQTESAEVNTHTYTDGVETHTITISGLTSIDNSAFKSCSNLTSITIGNSVTSIGGGAFYNCTNLTNVTIPNSVTSFGDYIFNDCANLQYNLKDNLKYLGNSENPYIYLGNNSETDITTADIDSHCRFISSYAFYNFRSLTSVNIPDGVTRIGDYAFYNCSSLTSITIPNSVTSIGNYAFLECTSLKSLKLGNGLTSVGFYVFQKCSSLTSVTIPKSLKVITNGMFHSCSNLESVTIPEGVESIELNTFAYCEKLTCMVIPESVTGIGKNAFEDCTALNSIILFNPNPPTLGSSAIRDNVQFIYVPQSSKAAYKGNTNWATYKTKIVSDNIYLSFVRFNRKNKEYIGEKINESWNDFNLENGAGENSVQQKGNSSKGARSATFGEGNISNADNQFIIGKYADADAVPDARFIVGGGYSNTNRSNVLALLKNGELLLPKLPEQSNAVIRLDDLERAVYPIIVRTYSDTLLKASNVGHYYYFTDASVITNSDKWIEPNGIHAENKVVTIVEITDSHTGNPAYFFKIVELDERELYLTNGQGKCSIVKKAYGTDTTPKAIGYYSTVFSVNTDSTFGGQAASKYTTLFGVNVRANRNAEGSIVGGRYCIIDSPYTFAYGRGITTQANNETLAKAIFGYNNKFNTKAIIEVGNGTDTNKSNAFEVLKDGRAKVQSAPTENYDVVRKLELDNLSNDIDTAMSIAKGRATGYVFDTKEDMDAWLENSENVSNLVLGDNLYIRATNVPDYWWDGSSAQMLETQKVDLTGYVKQSYVDSYFISKPTTPTEDSAVILKTDGTTETKALSEIGGGVLIDASLLGG